MLHIQQSKKVTNPCFSRMIIPKHKLFAAVVWKGWETRQQIGCVKPDSWILLKTNSRSDTPSERAMSSVWSWLACVELGCQAYKGFSGACAVRYFVNCNGDLQMNRHLFLFVFAFYNGFNHSFPNKISTFLRNPNYCQTCRVVLPIIQYKIKLKMISISFLNLN